MKIVAYTTLDRSRLILAEKRNKTNSAAVANRYSVPLVEAATVERLAEALDNTAASLETMLAHFGHMTPAGDNAARERILAEARAELAAFHGEQP